MEENKKQFLVTFLMGVAIIGISAYTGSFITAKNQITDEDFRYFKAGYHDSYVNVARAVINNCGEFPVRVVEQLDLAGRIRGVMLWCQRPDINITVPLPYTELYYKNPKYNQSTRIVYK